MSHLATVKTELRDIKAIKAACDELGFTFHENKKTHRLWGGVNAPCAHAISHPRWMELEVGLVATPTGYTLSFDDMLQRWDGMKAGTHIGDKASRLVQLYGVQKATMEAKKLGYMVSRKTGQNGAIRLTVSGI